jgi:putative radical SAM enzyme (TIGR03279 family)
MSAIVSEVLKNSLAKKGGIKPGDKILQVNRASLRDIIDYQIAVEELELELLVERNGKKSKISLQRKENEPVGIKFESSIFNNLKQCKNNCIFCFLDQLPKGLRKNLYVRDDDYRLSFLYGNFITLTNIDEDDLNRIISQKLSPLYISLHATNKELRKKIFRGSEDKALSYLDTLLKSGIEIHIQIVLCPEINDGVNLENTLRELDLRFSQVKSIGIVPVGLAKFRSKLYPLRLFTAKESRNLIRKIRALQNQFLEKKGTSWVFLADEFYLQAGELLPSFEHYEDFPQLENGIGITQMFMHEIEENLKHFPQSSKLQNSFTIITGRLAAPILEKAFKKIQIRLGGNFNIIGITNNFFGENITVAGLITARDIIDFVKSRKISGALLIPEVMLNSEKIFLDDISFSELKRIIEVPIEKVSVDRKQLLEKLSAMGG